MNAPATKQEDCISKRDKVADATYTLGALADLILCCCTSDTAMSIQSLDWISSTITSAKETIEQHFDLI